MDEDLSKFIRRRKDVTALECQVNVCNLIRKFSGK